MSWAKIREARAKIEKLTQDSRQLLDLAEKEGRELSAEEDGRFGEMHDEAEKVTREVDRLEKQLELEGAVANRRGHDIAGREDTNGADNGQERSEEEDKAFRHQTQVRYIREGITGLDQEQRELMMTGMTQLTAEQRAMGVGSDTAGGFLVIDEQFTGGVEQATLQFGGMERAGAMVINTTGGGPLPIPTSDDTSNSGSMLGENTAASPTDAAVGQVVLGEYTFTSDLIPVAHQLLQDSGFPVDTWLSRLAGERVGRALNTKFTTNSGTGPKGLIQSTTLGVTAASATAITFDEIIDLEHSVDPSYRESPSSGFMFNDGTLKAIKKLKDGNGAYLWSSGAQDGTAFREPPTLDGFRYTINQDMPAMTTGLKSMVFGQFDKYMIRKIGSPMMLRLDERYAEKFQVGFILFVRADGALIDAGTNPIKHLIQA